MKHVSSLSVFRGSPERTAKTNLSRRKRCTSLTEALESRTLFSSYTVSNLLDSGPGSLRAAVTAANANPGADSIKFAGGLKGTIPLASELAVTDDLSIKGTGNDKLTISGNHVTRVLHVTGAGTDLSIEHLTIADGRATSAGGTALGGAILNEGGSVSLSHSLLTGNQASGLAAGGGAIANVGGHLSADHTDFAGNSALGTVGQFLWGGALYLDDTAADLDHLSFANNKVAGGNTNGGAIGIVNGSQVSIDHVSFDANVSQGSGEDGGFGGAIEAQSFGFFASAAPHVDVSHCTFTNNQAMASVPTSGVDAFGVGNGGAMDIEDRAVVTVQHSSFDNNLARGPDGAAGGAGEGGGFGGASFGGAISAASASLRCSHCSFTNNETRGGSGGNGGAGFAGGDGAFGLGGAVSTTALVQTPFTAPTTNLDHCTFDNNRAIGGDGGAGGGGGDGGFASRGDGGAVIFLLGTGSISDSSMTNNAAQGGAGGAAGSGAGTVAGDGGLARGGGLANERGNATVLSDVVIRGNTATGGPGAAGGNGGDALGGGVFNGRQAGTGPDPAANATLTLDHSDVVSNTAKGGTGGAGGNGGSALGGGINNSNPAPVAGSPVLNLFSTRVIGNNANGGAAGAGGTAGDGVGGGLYNQDGAVANVDALSSITGNHASTSNDDIFGTITPI